MPENKFGIYFNADSGEVLRINSPYWIPEEPEWMCITAETNSTLKDIRNIVEDKFSNYDSQKIFWGILPFIEK